MPALLPVNPSDIGHNLGALGRRAQISFITNLPPDAYESDDKVTIIVASVLGSVALIAVVGLLIAGVIRRKRRLAERAKRRANRNPNDDDDDESDDSDSEEEAAVVPPPAQQQQQQQPKPTRTGFLGFGRRRS
ncbi:hypothetical protein H4R21_004359 [Coemansia helicoidea]|uniref:Uncharacterized protein n=1 Tax=Coemansia helicoidea TaxID=1286919 RepID=A0ACC1KXL4_9FUNG|nr:hypothetical protein H4R21_004359 [Coemansia helicoidea]